MIHLFLRLVLSGLTALGLQFTEVPVASAETLTEGTWPERHSLSVLETEEPETAPILTSYSSKTELLNLSNDELFWVVAILDGDTILVSAEDRSLFQVRLLAVDTNEINGPDSTAECYGYEAAVFTTEFLKNRAIRLTADPANEDLDPYGRKLRYVDVLQADGSFARLNDALLSEGYASFPSQYPVSTPDTFKALEKAAQDEEKGLWGVCEAL